MFAAKVQYNAANLEFELLDQEGLLICPSIAYGFEWTPIPANEAIFIQVWSIALPESQVIRLVNEEDKAVGWLCTVSALTSTAHEFVTSPHFRAGAGHAMQVLLENEAVQTALKKEARPTIDIFPSGACIFIAKKNLISADMSSDPHKILALLHRYGFSQYTFGEKNNRTAGKFATQNLKRDGKEIRKLKLQITSDAVPFLNFVNNLLLEPLSKNQDAAYTFFLYYQIIELLMEEVQRQKTLQFAKNLIESAEDSTKLYALMQNIKDHTSERGRIVALLNEYTNVEHHELDGLKNECLNFLSKLQHKESNNECGSALYNVRNMLIHNMRRISSDAHATMPLINEYLEIVVPKMLLTFTTANEAPPLPAA